MTCDIYMKLKSTNKFYWNLPTVPICPDYPSLAFELLDPEKLLTPGQIGLVTWNAPRLTHLPTAWS